MLKLLRDFYDKLPARIYSAPAAYITGILLIIVTEKIFGSFFAFLHVKIFFLTMSFGFDQYSADFVLATIKSVLIISTQILLVLSGLKLYRLELSETGWRTPFNPLILIIGIIAIIASKTLTDVTTYHSFKGLWPTAIHFAPGMFWEKLHNPVAYHQLFTIPLILPIFEELFFRGFVQTAFDKRFGSITAILATALIFTSWHCTTLGLNFNVVIFIDAIIFSILRRLDGSLWSSTAAHITHNLLIAWLAVTF